MTPIVSQAGAMTDQGNAGTVKVAPLESVALDRFEATQGIALMREVLTQS